MPMLCKAEVTLGKAFVSISAIFRHESTRENLIKPLPMISRQRYL